MHTSVITTIKIALKEIQKREDKRWVTYTDSQELYAVHQIQQKKPNIKSDLLYP